MEGFPQAFQKLFTTYPHNVDNFWITCGKAVYSMWKEKRGSLVRERKRRSKKRFTGRKRLFSSWFCKV